jgi:hypothetical protein
LFDELSRAFQRMARDADRMASLARVYSDDQAGDRPQLRVVPGAADAWDIDPAVVDVPGTANRKGRVRIRRLAE